MINPMLIPRYLGGKSSDEKYPVWDGQTYDLVLSPFAGSLRQEIKMLLYGRCKNLWAADSDPAVRAVIQCWMEQDGGVIHFIKKFISPIISKEKVPSEVFEKLEHIIDHGTAPSLAAYAAAKILLHQFVHGGNVRANEQGFLNVSIRTDKEDWAKWLSGYSYTLPYCPPSTEIRLFDDWAKVFEGVPHDARTLAFIDAPYSAPGKGQRTAGLGMSKAYSNHGGSPNDPALLRMHRGAVLMAMRRKCDRIVATNYHGHWLQDVEYDDDGFPHVLGQEWVPYVEITEFMQKHGFYFHDLGPLSGVTPKKVKPEKAGTKEQKAIRHEGWWEQGGLRQHGRIVQKNLFEEIAA